MDLIQKIMACHRAKEVKAYSGIPSVENFDGCMRSLNGEATYCKADILVPGSSFPISLAMCLPMECGEDELELILNGLCKVPSCKILPHSFQSICSYTHAAFCDPVDRFSYKPGALRLQCTKDPVPLRLSSSPTPSSLLPTPSLGARWNDFSTLLKSTLQCGDGLPVLYTPGNKERFLASGGVNDLGDYDACRKLEDNPNMNAQYCLAGYKLPIPMGFEEYAVGGLCLKKDCSRTAYESMTEFICTSKHTAGGNVCVSLAAYINPMACLSIQLFKCPGGKISRRLTQLEAGSADENLTQDQERSHTSLRGEGEQTTDGERNEIYRSLYGEISNTSNSLLSILNDIQLMNTEDINSWSQKHVLGKEDDVPQGEKKESLSAISIELISRLCLSHNLSFQEILNSVQQSTGHSIHPWVAEQCLTSQCDSPVDDQRLVSSPLVKKTSLSLLSSEELYSTLKNQRQSASSPSSTDTLSSSIVQTSPHSLLAGSMAYGDNVIFVNSFVKEPPSNKPDVSIACFGEKPPTMTFGVYAMLVCIGLLFLVLPYFAYRQAKAIKRRAVERSPASLTTALLEVPSAPSVEEVGQGSTLIVRQVANDYATTRERKTSISEMNSVLEPGAVPLTNRVNELSETTVLPQRDLVMSPPRTRTERMIPGEERRLPVREERPERNEEKEETLLQCFNLDENWKKLSKVRSPNVKPDQGHAIDSLNSIRVLAMLWVVLGHALMGKIMGAQVKNIAEVPTLTSKALFLIFTLAPYSVDMFFIMAGLLCSYSVVGKIRKDRQKAIAAGKTPRNPATLIPMIVVHRYLRIVPVLLFTIGFTYYLMGYLGSGPRWPLLQDLVKYGTRNLFMAEDPAMKTGGCSSYWHWTLFMFNNFIPGLGDMCLPWTWYLSNDFQFFLVGLVLSVLYVKKKKTAVTLSSLLLIGGCIATFFISRHIDFRSGGTMSMEYMEHFYFKPWCRCPPYLIGLLLGFLMLEKKEEMKEFCKNKTASGWIIGISVFSFITLAYLTYDLKQPETKWSLNAHSLFIALDRSVWALATLSIALVCHLGGAPKLNDVLAHRLWEPVSRLAFVCYMFHFVVLWAVFYSQPFQLYFRLQTLFAFFCYSAILTFLVAIPVTLFVEMPFGSLEAILVGRLTGERKRAVKDAAVVPKRQHSISTPQRKLVLVEKQSPTQNLLEERA